MKAVAALAMTAAVLAGVCLLIGMILRSLAVDANTQEHGAVPADELLDVSFSPDDRYSLISQKSVTPPYHEAPILQQLVKAGDLPKVHERLPDQPVVLRGVDGPGRYGGTWLRLAHAPSDVNIVANRLSGVGLVRWSPLGEPVEPLLAKWYKVSDDARTFTFRLREGIRWSDGAPFTVDDIMYRWEAELLDEQVGLGRPPEWIMNGTDAPVFEKVDDLTLRIHFDHPNPIFPKILATRGFSLCNSPRHYLEPYHPELGDPDLIKREMDAFSLPSPRALYAYVKVVTNPEHPRLWPWVYRTHQPDPPIVLVRNPYYFAVDEQGQQLPYIDRVQFEVIQASQFPLAVSTGKATMQLRGIDFSDVVEYLSRAQEGSIDVLSWYSATRAMWVLSPNLTRRVGADKASQWKAKYLGDKRFRQAISLAIDRQRIIDAEYKGVGQPSQVQPGEESAFASEVLGNAFTQYDPQRAETLLDSIGFKRPAPGRMRQAPDGTPVVFFIDYTGYSGRGPADFIVADWERIGVHAVARERARSLFYAQLHGRTTDFAVWSSESDYEPLVSPRCFVPRNGSFWAMGWQDWAAMGGESDPENSASNAPPMGHPARQALSLFNKARSAPTQAERVALFRELAALVADEVWTIAISTHPPQLVVKDPDLKNVPKNALVGGIYNSPANAGVETYFFATKSDPSGADEQTLRALRNITPRPRAGGATSADEAPADGFDVGWWVSFLFWIAAAIALILVAVRHPYIGQRLVVMVPTVIIMSVVIFTIIQLPPGDYLMARLIELEEQGDANAEQQIEDMKEMFHFDEPVVTRYLRWVGLYWFTSFSPADTGLLQGDLGRSMATGQPVNYIVGDRIVLTIAISTGTIAFTWLLAIPIGIYSAVRQYSWSDYLFTVIGFLGMSIPNFLFALVLMAMVGVSGLFSAEYATDPNWSWGKFFDLLGHIWIPILVIGTGGTAGMIRIMRANLLDELRKPYVVTARAKGVRPLKLLLKYPVRLAINPFISGIGTLLPQLVSGGSIVAIVLALPTVGPLLLESLLQEDMYMAGSMLLVLSLLGVIGTLLSDLLLLVVDPRIRYEGTNR